MKIKFLYIIAFGIIAKIHAQSQKADTKLGLYLGEGTGISLSASISENDYLTMSFSAHSVTMHVDLAEKYHQYLNQSYTTIYGLALYWESHNYFEKYKRLYRINTLGLQARIINDFKGSYNSLYPSQDLGHEIYQVDRIKTIGLIGTIGFGYQLNDAFDIQLDGGSYLELSDTYLYQNVQYRLGLIYKIP